MKNAPGRWKPPEATKRINQCARGGDLNLSLTLHAKDRMRQRGLIMADVLHVLKTGFVYEDGEESTQQGYFKYQIEGVSPNSNGRTVCAVIIPSNRCDLKLVTLMWRDEK